MANRFEKAAEKAKKPAGGTLPEELTAGTEKREEVAVPPVVEEIPVEAPPVAQPVQEAAPAPVAAPVPQEEKKADGLVAIYQTKMGAEPEPRNIRLQAVITPSLNAKLNELVASGAIKSRNDLINFLLERYFKELDQSAN